MTKNNIIKMGANFIGYFAEFGLGNANTGVLESLRRVFKEVNIVDISKVDGDIIEYIRQRVDWDLIYMIYGFNAEAMSYANMLEVDRSRHICIGYWAWELDNFPHKLVPYDCLDEIWTISRYCQDSISRVSEVPVINIGQPLLTGLFDNQPDENQLNMDVGEYMANLVKTHNLETRIVHLLIFDTNSSIERKNPKVILDLFRQYFADDPEHVLIVKITGNSSIRDEYTDVRNIIFITEHLSHTEMCDLYKITDCYIQSSRSEGFGRCIMEALYFRTPVICMAVSAMIEFYHNGNLLLIDSKAESVKCPIYEFYTDGDLERYTWHQIADPEQVYSHMKSIKKSAKNSSKNASFSEYVAQRYNVEHTAKIIADRISLRSKCHLLKVAENSWVLGSVTKSPNIDLYKMVNPDLRALNRCALQAHYKRREVRNKHVHWESASLFAILKSLGWSTYGYTAEWFNPTDGRPIDIEYKVPNEEPIILI
jgi:glycosyltransferase involved in cell wall biosynthesis